MTFMNIGIFSALVTLLAASNTWAAESPTMTLALAQKLSAKVLECGKKNNWKLCVAVVNSESNLVSFERTDGSYQGSIDVSIAKAKASNAFQRPTRAFVEAVKAGNVGLLSVPGVIANEGGVQVMIKGVQVGAIGVSGAKAVEDDVCAKEAIASLE